MLRFAWRSRPLWWTFAVQTVALLAMTGVAALDRAAIPADAAWWSVPLALAPCVVVVVVAFPGTGGAGPRLVRTGKGFLVVAALGVVQLPVAVLVDGPGSNLAAVPAGAALACIGGGAALALLTLPTGYSLHQIAALPPPARRAALIWLPVLLVAVSVMVAGVQLGTTAEPGDDVLVLLGALFGLAGEVRSPVWLWAARAAAAVVLLAVLGILGMLTRRAPARRRR